MGYVVSWYGRVVDVRSWTFDEGSWRRSSRGDTAGCHVALAVLIHITHLQGRHTYRFRNNRTNDDTKYRTLMGKLIKLEANDWPKF